jgi:transcriptional regulator with XRE-family HTH domain
MNNLTEKLRYWRKKRNISKPDTKVFVENVLEELLEIYYDDKALIKSIQEHISKTYFNKKPIGEINTIDAIQDIQVFGVNETEQMGYDNILCNREVFKHIDCRDQELQPLSLVVLLQSDQY